MPRDSRPAAGLDEVHVARLHAVLPQSLNHKIMRIAAQPGHPELLALEIFRSFDFGLGENAVGQGVFGAGDENQIGRPLCESTYDRLSTADRKSTRLNSSHITISYA